MEGGLTQTTRPGETYIQLGHRIKHMEPGERMPPFSALLKEWGVTQRSLDIAYKRLEAEGAIEIKKQRGVFVRNPYAGGTFVFTAPEDLFVGRNRGRSQRNFFRETRRQLARHFPGSQLELHLTESPDQHHETREPQLRAYMAAHNRTKRVLGVFVGYHITEERTYADLAALDLPAVGLEGDDLHVTDGRYDAETMAAHLEGRGCRDIVLLSAFAEDQLDWPSFARAHPTVRYRYMGDGRDGDLVRRGIAYIQELIDQKSLPEAFVVGDDYFFEGMLQGARLRRVLLEEACELATVAQKDDDLFTLKPVARLEYCWDQVADAGLTIMRQKLTRQWQNRFLTLRPRLRVPEAPGPAVAAPGLVSG